MTGWINNHCFIPLKRTAEGPILDSREPQIRENDQPLAGDPSAQIKGAGFLGSACLLLNRIRNVLFDLDIVDRLRYHARGVVR